MMLFFRGYHSGGIWLLLHCQQKGPCTLSTHAMQIRLTSFKPIPVPDQCLTCTGMLRLSLTPLISRQYSSILPPQKHPSKHGNGSSSLPFSQPVSGGCGTGRAPYKRPYSLCWDMASVLSLSWHSLSTPRFLPTIWPPSCCASCCLSSPTLPVTARPWRTGHPLYSRIGPGQQRPLAPLTWSSCTRNGVCLAAMSLAHFLTWPSATPQIKLCLPGWTYQVKMISTNPLRSVNSCCHSFGCLHVASMKSVMQRLLRLAPHGIQAQCRHFSWQLAGENPPNDLFGFRDFRHD